jgi:colicin import membrane protein
MASKGAAGKIAKAWGAGVKELPRNSAWLLSRALTPLETTKDVAGNVTQSAGGNLADLARQAGASVMDVLPVGDSIELRLQRARAAAEDAQRAEDQAVSDAEEAKARSDEAREIAERCRAYVREVERQQAKEVDEKVAEARREADARVERARAAAQEDADGVVQRAKAEADDRAAKAREEAAAAQSKAKQTMADASASLAEARRLAKEATEVTKAAAEEAHRQAAQLTADAEREARSADERVAEAEQVGSRSAGSPGGGSRNRNGHSRSNELLNAMTRAELLELASAEDIKGRSAMSKSELLTALRRSARAGRR